MNNLINKINILLNEKSVIEYSSMEKILSILSTSIDQLNKSWELAQKYHKKIKIFKNDKLGKSIYNDEA